jgi:hypothetical protein
MFILRIAELLATQGMYRQLVNQLQLTIASTPRMSVAWTTRSVMLKDIAWALAEDGVTIQQARDATEWGQMTLNEWSQGVDPARMSEATQALLTVCQLSSMELYFALPHLVQMDSERNTLNARNPNRI